MTDLAIIITDFCFEHITWLVILELVSAIFAFVGYKQEWTPFRRAFEIVLAILTVILVILLIIYLFPFVISSL